MPTPQGSHPAVRFDQHRAPEGVLNRFEELRPGILQDVVSQTEGEFNPATLDLTIGEALYAERFRMKRDKGNIFTRRRRKGDHALWGRVQGGLLKSAAEVDRRKILHDIVEHYSEEIGGHFDPRIYPIATSVVPWGFNWLLNAASVRRFLPWGMTQSLSSRMHILGEVGQLQELSKKGTILLVPTHQSNLDSILIGYAIHLMELPPFAYGAGLNLFSNPFLNFFMSNLGAYTVDRQKSNAIYKATLKNYSTRILREGIHSIFFPGGGRCRSGAIETKLKLGLLGTGLEAQIDNMIAGKPDSKVFVVPMTVSYHFVLEASSLIEDYLADAGKHRFIIMDDESWQFMKVAHFFWKLFSSKSSVTLRIGKPLDVLGNFVDEQGQSVGPNGTIVDPKRWLSTRGELRHDNQRDREYTRELGNRISDRFHKENTVLTSHLVAFAFFESLRKRYPDLDLFRFLRLSQAQCSLQYPEFVTSAERYRDRVKALAERGELHLSDELRVKDAEGWVRDGIRELGILHEASVIKAKDGAIWSEDLNLLYYYRNRLAGYGLTTLKPGQNDAKGFLA